MMPFCNNLAKDDEVEHAPSKRRGLVHSQPRETSVNVHVLLDGISTPRYFPVTEIRLVVNGKPEDVPPIDGEPPKVEDRAPPTTNSPGSTPLNQLLRTRRDLLDKLANVDEHIFRLLAE